MMRVVAVTLLIFMAVGCSDDSKESTTPSTFTGTVVQVKMTGLTKVEFFTVRSEDKTYKVLIDPDTDLGFPPSHLNEHRISGEPVRVETEEKDGDLYATKVEDA